MAVGADRPSTVRHILDLPPQQARHDAERNSTFAIGVLHFFIALALPVLLWDSPAVDRQLVTIWAIAQAALGVIAFCASWSVIKQRVDLVTRFSQIESVGTAISFAGLPWLGDEIATMTPSKHVLMIVLIAVTSISAANSTHITERQSFFGKLIVIVGLSYLVAFTLQGEWIFAASTVLWCVSIVTLTRVGYRGMLELLELREASDRTAQRDDLTDLLSRTAFFSALDQRVEVQAAHEHGSSEPTALVLFDLDGFKAINDSFGHPSGDEVLKTIARRLEAHLPHGADIARLGGDEFAAIVGRSQEPLDDLLHTTLRSVSEPIRINERELYVAASCGWTLIDGKRYSAELIAEADAAMYQSKNSQTATSTGFDVALRDELEQALQLRQRFRASLRRNEITFFAQPIVRMIDRAPTAVELLARWPQGDHSIIGPEEFTRVAEETGLAIELDRQALSFARTLLERWASDSELSQVRVKANISPIHLHNEQLIDSVSELIPERLRERLGLEFVESSLIPAAERNYRQLRDLREMGVLLSIDDFGVGYSSLTYLRSLPVSEIKIDQSFMVNLDTDAINQGLIRAIVDIASTLGLPTVAEGIETSDAYAAAARLGVSSGQGFHMGRPLPIDQAEEALRALHRTAATLS